MGSRLDDRVRLSQSALYDLQRRFYEREGMQAWASGAVPSYITSNPLIADAYAEVVLGFLRDARAGGRLARGATVPVVEVGAGSGRFGWLLRRRLVQALAESELADVGITLVLTDFHPETLDEWRAHPSLAPLLDDGAVDLAVLDAADPGDPILTARGRSLSDVAGDGPRVLVANYVLDSLPTDAFAVRRGDLHELLVSVESDGDLEVQWTAGFVAGPGYYGDADLDGLLDHYAAHLDDTTVLVPTAAIELVRRFAGLAPGPALVVAADKGHLHEVDLHSQPEPVIARHGGCFSLMTNFDALRRVVERQGGVALHQPQQPTHLAVAAYAFGLDRTPATVGAFGRHVVERGPDDGYAVRSALAGVLEELSLDQLLAYVRTYLADGTVLLDCFPRLLDLAPTATEAARVDLHRLVDQVWDSHFPIGEAADLACCLGRLLAAVDRPREALAYFAASRRSHGPTSTVALAEAQAQVALRDLDAAVKLADEALALEPGLADARRLRAAVAAQAV